MTLGSVITRYGVLLVISCVAATLECFTHAADNWTDISSPLIQRLTNNGARPAWPGGWSAVAANRTNGDVTIAVVGLWFWRRCDRGANCQWIDQETTSGRAQTGWA